jgi:hypothetical protein
VFKASLGAVSHARLACSLSALGLACLAAPAAEAASKKAASAPDTLKAAPAAASAAPAVPAAASPVDSAKATVPAAAVPVDSAKPAAPAVAAPVDTSLKSAVAAPADSAAKAAVPDSATKAAAAAPAIDYGDSTQSSDKPKKRKRIVRETTVNTIDELKGRYRSPKKALFMSLVVPGMGQAYVGQHWFNYTRGAAYLLTDVGLALGWRHYVVTKQDRQIARYRAFADSNWRQEKFEETVSKFTQKDLFDDRFPHRESYCQSVQAQDGAKGTRLYKGCVSPEDEAAGYDEFRNEYKDNALPLDSVTARRKAFPNVHNFYELIGKEAEFVMGWRDAGDDITLNDSSFVKTVDGKQVTATTELQQEYIGMRAKANDYARMQAWFLGGMVLNHIVSALDAAFTAHVHNKSLYQTEVGFLDRLRLDSYMAWDGNAPVPTVTASITF